ncbi:MAG: 5-bromo-4-chloroindolyl phosphate hydrolysis family protein [Acetivibrio sp.]
MNQDWEKVGKDVRNLVQDAIDSQNFNKLNQSITNIVGDAVNGIQKSIYNAGKVVNQGANEAQKQIYRNQRTVPQAKEKELFEKKTSIRAGGIALTICGYILTIGIGIALLALCLVGIAIGKFPLGIKIALAILTPLWMGGGVMVWKGSSMLSMVTRYRKYISGLHGKTYCNIKELAQACGKSMKYVQKDVRMMIQRGWFREGHLDYENSCLIVSHDTYQEYQRLQQQKMEQKQMEEKQMELKRETPPVAQDKNCNSEVEKIIAEGKEYIKKIRECNDLIPGAEISNKISHMELLVSRILERVEQNPNSIDDIYKMMEYYLPTTVKLLEAYHELELQPIQGENIMSSKVEIEQTLTTLNIAFEKLLNSLFQDVAWDVSTDISVLQTMLAQEGLTGTDFKGEGSKT